MDSQAHSQAQMSVAWTKARDQFVKDLNEEEQRRFFQASPESLLDDAVAAERAHARDSTTRDVMEKLQPFVAAVEQYGTAIDVFSNTYSLALGPIWGSMKVLLHIAREFGKYFDKLIDMFTRIGDVLPRFKTYERLFSNHDRLIGALSKAYLSIITFCADAKAVFRRGQRSPKATLKMAFKLLWKPFDLQFGRQLNAFRECQKTIEKEAGLANMIEAADARAMILANQRQLEERRREDNRLRIIAMLNAIDYEASHRRFQNWRHAGTGAWLFRQSQYSDWVKSSKSAVLCCRGIPGCGKSVLASNVVDTLIEAVSTPTAPASNLIYYYCDYADQRSLHLDRILGSLLKQLYLNRRIPEHIESQLLQLYAVGTRSPPEIALASIFCSSVALLDNIYIIFDGLDECGKTVLQAILKNFKQLAAATPTNVKIFITCVEEGHVAHDLNEVACIQLSPSTTAADIKAFVESSVRLKIENRELRIRNPSLEQDITCKLVSKANGLFLWVHFQLEELCNASSDSVIQEILTNLPMGLGETYRRILIRISQTSTTARVAQKMFKWAAVAKRPLRVEEFKEAVAFDPGDKSWNEAKIPHEDRMFESCRGLIIKDDDDQTVRFAHHTVLQYLATGLSTTVDPFFEISNVEAEIFAGQICVGYLSFSDFETQVTTGPSKVNFENLGILQSGGPLWIPSVLGIRKSMFELPYRLLRDDTRTRTPQIDYSKHLNSNFIAKKEPSVALKDKYRLLPYVIDHWETHARSFPASYAELGSPFWRLALEKILAFEFRPWGPNQHHGLYGCVGCPNSSAGDLDATDLPHMSMLHYAAEVDNLPLQLLLGTRQESITHYLHHERDHDETLLIACRHGSIEIVRHLLAQGSFDITDRRAVNAAAAAGHVEVLRYLLSHGQSSIEGRAIEHYGEAALFLAAKNGQSAIIELLAEAGADLQATDQRTRQSLLEVAAMNGHDSLVQTLLKGGRLGFRNALHLAVENGHVAVTRAFLETDNLASAYIGWKSVAREALPEYIISRPEHAAGSLDPNDRETLFHLGARNGHVGILELFQEYVASVDSPWTTRDRTALHIAAAAGQDKAVRWLLENGADFNANDADGEKPLFLATKSGKESTVRILLEHGATTLAALTELWVGDSASLLNATPDDATVILELLLENMRGDRGYSNKDKLYEITWALDFSRTKGRVRTIEALERERALYKQKLVPRFAPSLGLQ